MDGNIRNERSSSTSTPLPAGPVRRIMNWRHRSIGHPTLVISDVAACLEPSPERPRIAADIPRAATAGPTFPLGRHGAIVHDLTSDVRLTYFLLTLSNGDILQFLHHMQHQRFVPSRDTSLHYAT